ncbi:MAG: transposase [Polyangiaceae bacterium]|nr:transposase [Polyangiaceae bacterium]
MKRRSSSSAPHPTPTRTEVAEVATRTRTHLERIFKKHGRSLDPHTPSEADAHPLEQQKPGLSACYTAAAQGVAVSGERAGQPTLRLVVAQSSPPQATSTAAPPDEPVAEVGGISLFAKQRVDGRDRRQLERLCRYITRPPVSQDRLEKCPDGRFELTLKSVWKDGTRAVLFEVQDLIARLIAAITPPRFHLVRYFGVPSSHSALRSEVVPTPCRDPTAHAPPPAPGDQ